MTEAIRYRSNDLLAHCHEILCGGYQPDEFLFVSLEDEGNCLAMYIVDSESYPFLVIFQRDGGAKIITNDEKYIKLSSHNIRTIARRENQARSIWERLFEEYDLKHGEGSEWEEDPADWTERLVSDFIESDIDG